MTAESDVVAAIARFVDSARDYCAWIEEEPLEPDADVAQAIRLLSRLVATINEVPNVHGELPDELDPTRPDDPLVERAVLRLSGFPCRFYRSIFYALDLDDDKDPIVMGDVVDDLLDTYRDVKGGLLTYDSGFQPLAIWDWRESFGFHWGRHAVSALKVLHEFAPYARAT